MEAKKDLVRVSQSYYKIVFLIISLISIYGTGDEMSRESFRLSDTGYGALELLKSQAARAAADSAFDTSGDLAGFFSISAAKEMDDPVLISVADGVGTKLKVAFIMDRHDSIGVDCVAMCANDIICRGATPLFFQGYRACSRIVADQASEILKGIKEGCLIAGMKLLGSETAEMPGFYSSGEYDLAGFAVGICDRADVVTGEKIVSGDAIIGIASSGVHASGFSFVRRVFRMARESMEEYVELIGQRLGEALMTPTRIYVNAVNELRRAMPVKGLCHITGGGFLENIPKILPKGAMAAINRKAWSPLPIFDLLAFAGDLNRKEMYGMFNMGIGMIAIVSGDQADAAITALQSIGEEAYIIGEIKSGEGCSIT